MGLDRRGLNKTVCFGQEKIYEWHEKNLQEPSFQEYDEQVQKEMNRRKAGNIDIK